MGALCLLTAFSGLFFDTRPAQAAILEDNLDYARKVVSGVWPFINSVPVDNQTATLILAPDGFISKPLVVETDITTAKVSLAQTTKAIALKSQTIKTKLSNDGANHFVYGYCTWYVASRRNIPWFGNAGTWISGARGAGFATGDKPQVGAIIVTSESRWGHVGMVESVNNNGTITISEMNYSGFARITSRTISTSYGTIKGYIY